MKKNIKKAAFFIATLTSLQVLTFGNVNSALAAPSVTAQENLKQLIKTRSCRGCDLSGLKLNTMDLAGVDLEGADLSFTKLYLTNLAGANLRNTKLNGAVFGGADLGEADLRGADLQGASLDSAYLGEALIDAKPAEEPPAPLAVGQSLQDTSIPAATTETKELMEVPTDVSIPKPPPATEITQEDEVIVDSPEKESVAHEVAEMDNATESGEQVIIAQDKGSEKSVINKTNIEQAGVTGSKSTSENPKGSEVAEKDLHAKPILDVGEAAATKSSQDNRKTVTNVDQSNEDLAVENVKKANLERLLDKNKCFGCDLSGLDLSGKNLKGADLEKADLSGCNFENAKLDRANLKGALLQHANLRNASLREADLYKADFTGADLTNADVKEALFDGAKISEAVGFSNSSVLINQ